MTDCDVCALRGEDGCPVLAHRYTGGGWMREAGGYLPSLTEHSGPTLVLPDGATKPVRAGWPPRVR